MPDIELTRDFRFIKAFAWWPKSIDGKRIWLSAYYKKQQKYYDWEFFYGEYMREEVWRTVKLYPKTYGLLFKI